MRIAVILHHIGYRSLGLAPAILLSACAGPVAPIEAPAETLPAVISERPPAGVVSGGKYDDKLSITAAQLRRNELVPAAANLQELQQANLASDQLLRYRDLQIRWLYLRGEIEAATRLTDTSLSEMVALSPDQCWHLHQWRLRLMRERGRRLGSAREGSELLKTLATGEHRAALREQIWLDLQNTPLESLRRELGQTKSRGWRGWLQLALHGADDAVEPAIQLADWRKWQRSNPEHPAALEPPPGTGAVPEKIPAAVALILPLSGELAPAAQALIDGYMAASYDAREHGWPNQTIRILDINRYRDINDAYARATALGVDLIIGPLAKSTLQQWRTDSADTAPVLTLNRVEWSRETSVPVYQLSLAPEDEAEQLAQWAHGRGARNALIVRPRGGFGATLSGSFTTTWNKLSGRIAAEAIYDDQNSYSASIREALELTGSEARAATIHQLMDTPIEFTPRRRQDIDSVFLFAGKPQEARSLKPLIAFHYAGDLPIYGTSHIYSGRTNPQRDRDLNGIRLLAIPWLLETPDPMRDTLIGADYQNNLASMYALGADAFSIHWRLAQFKEHSGQTVRGRTGLLSMDAQGRIYRELRPARMQRGAPIADGG